MKNPSLSGPGVYMLTCVPTGDRYVGASKVIGHRLWQHAQRIRLNDHSNGPINDLAAAHSLSGFRYCILERCSTESEAFTQEIVWIDRLRPSLNRTAEAKEAAGDLFADAEIPKESFPLNAMLTHPCCSLLQAYIDTELSRRFKSFAILNGKTSTDVIAELMQQYVDAHTAEPAAKKRVK